jgi:hypothetical protein
MNRTIGQPKKTTLIFGRKVTRQYKGKLQTELEDLDLPNPVIRSHYAHGFSKPDVRDDRLLRTKPATHDATDYGVKKNVENLPLLRQRMSEIIDPARIARRIELPPTDLPERRLGEPALTLATRTPMTGARSKRLGFPCALGTRQELRHVLVLGGVVRPPFRSRIPAIIANRHIDAAVNEELRCFVVRVDGALMQDACRFVRAPVRIDVGSMFQKKVRNLKLPIHTCPCERDVQDVLGVRGYPMKIPEPGRIVDGVMLTEAPQPRTTGLIKPTLDSREVPCAGRVGQIVGQRPNLSQ